MAAPKHIDTPKAPDLRQRAAGLRDELAKPRKRRAAPQVAPEPVAAPAPLSAGPPSILADDIAAAWTKWAVTSDDDDALWEQLDARRTTLIRAAEALPATRDSLTAKSLALTWIVVADLWRAGRERADYATDGRLALDIDAIMRGAAVAPAPAQAPDPFLTAVAFARAADSAVAAFEVRIEDRKPDDWIEQETALCAEQRRTRDIALATVPTTRAGQIALVDYLDELVRQHGYANGDPPDDESEVWRLGYRAMAAALRVPVSPDDEPEAEELATIEKMSVLDFGAYDFDTPLRDPGAWSKAFATHAIGMHIADKTLRMTKPEMVAFITDAGERDDEVPGILFKAMDAAQETFEGWGKLLATASARYRVAGSVAVIADAATGEA